MPAIELQLSQITTQDPDGTINFDASGISTIKVAPVSFMIFYLAQEDEANGYGTVIQLDDNHQASIYPDLNPEYTYLFFRDEQGNLQTLLWCIEFATRTEDGLYITQAKVHGRGVTEADMQRFNQIMVTPGQAPAPAHNLAESYTPPAPPAPAIQTPPPAAQPQPTLPTQPAAPVTPPVSAPVAAPVVSPPPVAVPTPPAVNQPVPALDLPPLPELPTNPVPPQAPPAVAPSAAAPVQPAAPVAFPQLPDLSNPEPIPTIQPANPTAQPGMASPMPADPAIEAAKNPVGRPPKPLHDATWLLEQSDFVWIKSISRDPIGANKQLLRQKLDAQIQHNQPDLLNDPQFVARLNQAFEAICQTYDLTPIIRQDLLKALLNGRIIANLA